MSNTPSTPTPDPNATGDAAQVAEQLRVHVGDAVFRRGEADFAAGRVAELAVEGDRATAEVRGRSTSHVQVRRTPRGFEGACDCPESDGFDFCRHCVSVALAVTAHAAERDRAAAAAPEERLRVYLSGRPKSELVDLLCTASEQVPELKKRLQLRSDVASGAVDRRALKKQVTAALPLRDVWQRSKVRAYFSHAVSALTALVEIAPDVPADELMAVAEYAITRLDKVLERVDDSDGHRWFAQDRIRELYALALARSDFSAADKAAHLLTRILNDPGDAFNGGPGEFSDALGEDGVASFYALVRTRLDGLTDATDDAALDALRLRRLLRSRFESLGDLDGLIALQLESCSTAYDHYRLAELYLEAARLDMALDALNKGDELADDARQDLLLRVRIHEAREEWADAVDAQHGELIRQPTIEAYDTLQRLAEKAGDAKRSMRRAESQLARQLNAGHHGRSAAATVLAKVAWARDDRDRAFDVAVEHIHDADTLLPMIEGFRQDQPARAAQLFDCAIEATLVSRKNGAYRDAVQLIREYRGLFDDLGPGMFDAFITDLRDRHKAKRNLMMLLEGSDHLSG